VDVGIQDGVIDIIEVSEYQQQLAVHTFLIYETVA
jgi:hypothetical protein